MICWEFNISFLKKITMTLRLIGLNLVKTIYKPLKKTVGSLSFSRMGLVTPKTQYFIRPKNKHTE